MTAARSQGELETLPVRRSRKRIPHYKAAAAVTTRADGCVLVAQRKADDMLGGLRCRGVAHATTRWEFPGGKREEGETLPECLVREMREELDVEVEVGELRCRVVAHDTTRLIVVKHTYSHFRLTLHTFRCRLAAGEPHCLECAAFRWVTLAELDALPMSVADRKIAQTLCDAGA